MTNQALRNHMQRLPIYGIVMDFSRRLIGRILEDRLYATEDYAPNGIVYQKAIFDMLLRDPRNIESFVFYDYDEIRFSEHTGKIDKKTGKIKKLQHVRADMVKRKTFTQKA